MKGYRFILSYLAIVAALLLLLLFCGCATKVVTVPEYHTEYVTKTDSFVRSDSIHVFDSVYIIKSGDTITTYRTRLVYQDRWREFVRLDTVLRCDSIPYVVEVEKSLTWWDRQKVEFGGLAMLFMVVLLCFVVFKHKYFK